jgi:hypothetical protein
LHRGALPIVIPFLIVTSIINLSLGYALAIYLGRTSSKMAAPQAPAATSASMGSIGGFPTGAFTTNGRDFTWPHEAAAAAAAAAANGMLSQTTEAPTPEPILHTPATEEHEAVQTRTAEMEQDLLAGIEEFRNQLAQLKGQASMTVEPPLVGAR